MIDYITAKFPCRHQFFKIEAFKNPLKRARVFNGYTSIEVKSANDGRYIIVSGNPIKYFQGHNVFGSNDLHGLCKRLFQSLSKALNINVMKEDVDAVDNGEYTLSRVDLALNFRLPSNEDVTLAIREIEWHWRELGKNVSNYRDNTVYQNQHSSVCTAKFYNKLKELIARPLSKKLLERDRLLRYAKNLLRVEFTLRSPALKRLKLNEGSAWTVQLAKLTVLDYLKTLRVDRKVKRMVRPKNYEQLTHKQRQIYHLWIHGEQLTSLYTKNTLHRRRRELLCFGIDIGQPRPKQRCIKTPISTLLSCENLATYPKFAKPSGLIYFPSLDFHNKT